MQGKSFYSNKRYLNIHCKTTLLILEFEIDVLLGFLLQGVQSHLVQIVLDNAANLTYERLSREIDNMVGQDRSWSNFVMAMNVGKRVCLETSKACSAVTSYFRRYISQSYSEAMQEAGGVVS